MQNWELDKSEGNGAVMKWSDEFQSVCGIFGITYTAEVDNSPPVDRMELQSLQMFIVTHLMSNTWIATLGVSRTIGNFLTYHILCDTRRVTQTSDVAHIPLEQWHDAHTSRH